MSVKVKYVDENGVPRNYRDQPVLLDPHGNPKAYGRVSSYGKALDGGGGPGLTQWHQRLAIAGVTLNHPLQMWAHELVQEHGTDPQDKAVKDEWNTLVAQAMETANSDYWSRTGTAVHAAIETLHKTGHAPTALELEPQYHGHVEAFNARVDRDFDILDAEVFVVNDEFSVAGTFDLLLRHRESGALMVGDIKTGFHDNRYPVPVTVQVALYATAQRYDLVTNERSPLAAGVEVSSTSGVLAHVPAKVQPAKCELYPLDLKRGLELADLARRVKLEGKMPPLKAWIET